VIGADIDTAVRDAITPYEQSALKSMVDAADGERLAIKFVASGWAQRYASPQRLKISETPALTWGTATYVTPIAYPLSSVLYGRIGLVAEFDPTGWNIFDATQPAARYAYMRWARAQTLFEELVLTVHSTFANHTLRNQFRKQYAIDCVLFHPDQEAELHTDMTSHVWMAVTDWLPPEPGVRAEPEIDSTLSTRLADARFTVLIDEEFDLLDSGGLPIQVANRKIEATTAGFTSPVCIPVSRARSDPSLPATIAANYRQDGYVHIYVEP
jgi:hypothetical protein